MEKLFCGGAGKRKQSKAAKLLQRAVSLQLDVPYWTGGVVVDSPQLCEKMSQDHQQLLLKRIP